ncbi:aldo/keto reductase [Sulfurifustis variabilis]|uniref:Aldo/keto reductase n=1 Tax=Sulfurifustis variabilis TaxID=1675686 RepID=A0A1B4V796_9GAMM|nr:aldo/keto reductase [Sulfurifustis variabilis]BAU49406.1 aldo/keto reductase [Sulfurifustis variabilis]
MATTDHVTSAYSVRSPRIIYGTAWKKDRTEALVRTAIELGFRGIDTAGQPRHYDEAGVGAGVAACLNDHLRRADLYLQTKFTSLPGQDPARVPYDPKAPLAEQVAQSFKTSVHNLRTDYVDCFILHSPMGEGRQTTEVWRAMELLFDNGGARQLGISNCYSLTYLETLYRTMRVKPAVVQNRFYAQTGYDREIRAFCRLHGIIYQSFWTLTANPHVLAHDDVKLLASKYGRTPAQVLFRYLTQNDVVPLTGTSTEAHMREDLQILDFELTEDEVGRVTALF